VPQFSFVAAKEELQTKSVPQKNTFIHFDPPADAATGPPTFSAPAKMFQVPQLAMLPTACTDAAKKKSEAESCESPTESFFANTPMGDEPFYLFNDTTQPNFSKVFPYAIINGHKAPPLLQPLQATQTFSIGSALHETGRCEPCAWFWKPQGCKNGSECSRCHLCPKEALKEAKKAKAKAKAAISRMPQFGSKLLRKFPAEQVYCERGTVAMQLEDAVVADGQFDNGKPQERTAEVLPTGMPEPPMMSSEGTAMELTHARGECRPCAYFWRKADGCRKGSDCPFCHICDQDAVKRKKKELKKEFKMTKTFSDNLNS